MKIAMVSDWFAEQMGYSENCLPKAVASLGHEVHLITANVKPYFDSPNYEEIYQPFIGPGIVPCASKTLDGYVLHRLPHGRWRGHLRIQGLRRKLLELRPDIVQTFDVFSLTTVEAALLRARAGYRLFLESHLHASVLSRENSGPHRIQKMRRWAKKNSVGKLIGLATEKCYPISSDAAEIVAEVSGIPDTKIEICSLGVDTDLFSPALDAASRRHREELRKHLGFSNTDIVCIYTGRFSKDKNPACLARAIDLLSRKRQPFHGLFVGNGPQSEVEVIRSATACSIHHFVPFDQLPGFYRAADIGVWPRQESTSQLDAAACGLPLVLSSRVQVTERVEGNGLKYQEDNIEDLASKLSSLADPGLRQRLGQSGCQKMRDRFSWHAIARQRVRDYEASVAKRKGLS
jgi:glycosyltransferase involved in cell wall biosynthesis